MDTVIVILEMIGTIAFAISGAVMGIKKNMDIFGVCMLGLTTAVGGGIIRDVLLGFTPPVMFRDWKYAAAAVAVSVVAFLPFVRGPIVRDGKIHDVLLLVTDSAGLGVFTACGARAAISGGYGDNTFLVVFVAVVTGVGGGVLRDMFVGFKPYIFVKHIYACASIAGALVCCWLWPLVGENIAMTAGMALIFALRLCSAKFRWSLPKAGNME